ncbi:MAG TPA: inositol monophosphatase [Candidatus Saccharimonadales bacterium]|nr:inositol monophosphatase [Candidatus Saccharimonadales bacterium]
MDTVTQRRDLIKQAAVTAGKFIKTAKPTEGIVSKEGRGNFATAADLASEKIVIDLISKQFPEDKILSEETNSEIKDMFSIDHLWIIDPIDGTHNFRYDRNYSCVSIAYIEKGITKLGAAYNPYVDELFFAEANRGSYINDIKMNIGDQIDLSQASVGTDNSYNPAQSQQRLELLLLLQPTPWVAIKGSSVLTIAEVACGRMDLYFTTSVSPWDTAAALLMLQEAGGIARNFKGEPITFDSREVIVGNEELVNQFIDTVKKHPEIHIL